jgi:predicted metal-dependent hydrolase
MLAHRRWFRRHLSARTRLGMTAAAEHYTASLAYLMVYGTTSLLNGMGRPYQDLLLYHAMEEVEHKAVCYDLYQALSGSYPRRALTFLFISFYVWLNIYLRNRYLLSADGLWGGRRSRDARSFYWGNRGVLRLLLPRMRQYLRRSFHPWQSDERLDFERTFGELRESLGIAPFG